MPKARSKIFYAGKRIVIYILTIYIIWCVVVFFMQGAVMFPTSMVGEPGAGPWRGDAVVMTRPIGSERKVTAWLFPAPGASADQPAPLVVYCHGNGELIDTQQRIVEAYHAMGVSVLLPEYRGYGHSDGKPGQRVLTDDAIHFIEQIASRDDVDAQRLIYHGRSIGGAVAAQLAKRREPAALIAESTFTHTGAFARRFGVPPVPGIIRYPFRTKDVLPKLRCPVLLFHGEADTVIPVKHGRNLHAITPGSRLITYPDVGHNDFPGWSNEPMFWQEIREFLENGGLLTTPHP